MNAPSASLAISLEELDIEHNIEVVTHYLKLLANKHRLLVMCKISKQPRSVSELVGMLDMAQPALSMHLAKLREEGWVVTQREGKEIYYSIASDELKELLSHICMLIQNWNKNVD